MEATKRDFPPATGGEVEVLGGWLDWQRGTVHRTCAGLDEAAGRARTVTASSMTMTSLVWHLAWVEHHWFHASFLGLEPSTDPDCGWSRPGTLSEGLQACARNCLRFPEIVTEHEASELEAFAPPGLPVVSLRCIVRHVLEETARHVGHLDLLRESTDGVRGC